MYIERFVKICEVGAFALQWCEGKKLDFNCDHYIGRN